MVVFKMRESVPTARYSPVCNVLRQWKTSLILTYRVYRLYDTQRFLTEHYYCVACALLYSTVACSALYIILKGSSQSITIVWHVLCCALLYHVQPYILYSKVPLRALLLCGMCFVVLNCTMFSPIYYTQKFLSEHYYCVACALLYSTVPCSALYIILKSSSQSITIVTVWHVLCCALL